MENPNLAVLLPLLALVSTAAWLDARCYRIPNWLAGLGCACGLCVAACQLHRVGVEHSLLAMAAGFFLTLPFWLLGWLGAGDVKMMAAVGAVLGLPLIFKALIFTAFSGMLLVLLELIHYGQLSYLLVRIIALLRIQFGGVLTELPSCDTDIDHIRLPYALAIACGSLSALLQG